MIGESLGHFRVVERIGAGGVGTVYRAHDEQLGRDVAIKVLLTGTFSNESARKHFRREALILSKLNHPNIETIHEFSSQDGVDFLVMEYVLGHTLNEILLHGPLPEKEISRLGAQLAEGLIAAHENEIIHRDLKPANVRITPDGRLKILDFGLAKLVPRLIEAAITESLDESEKAMGTLPYMSPEQVRGEKLDARSDIYSAGVVLYEMATGIRPFTDRQIPRLVDSILHQEPRSPSTLNHKISPVLENIIIKCLDKDPDHRYQSARELKVDLERLTMPSTGTPFPAPRPLWREHRRLIISGIAVVLVLLGLFLAKNWLPFPGRMHATGLPSEKHVAVLPFTNLGEDPTNRAFCDGLTETLTSELTQLTQFQDALWVIPSTEIRKEKITSAREARNSFGATLVITGSVQRRGGHVYLIANLVDTKALRQLRVVTIDTSVENLNLMQENVIRQIAGMLEVPLKPEPKRIGAGGSTAIAGAYDFYLQGEGYLYRFDKVENLDSAIRLFQQALALDPRYTLAYAGLAKAYLQKYDLTGDPQWVEPARENCKKAVELDGELLPVRIIRGTILRRTGEYQESIVEFQKALQIDSSSFDAWLGLAKAYDEVGQTEKAEASYRGAIVLQPDIWYGYNSLGGFFYNQSRYKEAVEMFEKVVQLLPDNARGYSNLGGVYMEIGRYEEGISLIKKSIEIRPTSDAYWNLGYSYYMMRRFPESAAAYWEAVHLRERLHYSIIGELGDAYYWSPGLRVKANEEYQQAIQLAKEELDKVDPHSADALLMTAYFQAKLGNKNESLDNLRQALERKSNNPHYMFLAGLVLNQTGRPAEALDYLERAIQRGYSRAELNRIEFDNLRAEPRFQALTQKQK